MHQHLLHSIAGSRVVCFGIYHNLACQVQVSILVDVDVADAVRMAHDWDLCVLLDAAHQGIASAGYHLHKGEETLVMCHTRMSPDVRSGRSIPEILAACPIEP